MPAKFSPSPRSIALSAAFVAGGIFTGAIGWSGHTLALAAGVLFPALWAFAPSRVVAALVALAHFLAASRGLPEGVAIFYGSDMGMGLALWLLASLMFVAVHTVLWTRRAGWQRPIRYAIAAILMSLPPFGIAGWASPITAAGVLFPGWGWFGLAATATGLLILTTRLWPIAALTLGGSFAVSAATWTPPNLPEGWQGINTSFQFSEAGQYADYAQHMATIAMVREAAGQGASLVVLPESAFGIWTATAERLWTRELAGIDVVVNGGAIVIDQTGYDNVMVQVSGHGSEVIYYERMPVPISMWQPWATGGAHAHFFANPVVDFAGVSIAPLICYEQLIIWPILQSMLFDPEVIVATGNGWWTGDTNIVAIQKASAEAWAALFGLPLVMAFNH
ncbi:conjugal transfer protein TraB [Mesorhizobium sp. YIM 152430]|uniref:conjugal transfer protein TraB n=1 Tax=Mesorhizobium sp. YIM 152430 TaxID=3031761 RepID=UPI0023DB8BE1|nr:conjugal transfer protein TraB [Mesorhizobium sp. YIM 152430]MDF1600345.1 conjugal transfer protein TraB [Mesorhizobium sp. YIM 152430]